MPERIRKVNNLHLMDADAETVHLLMSVGPEMFVSRAEIHDASSQKSSDRETVAVPRPRVRIMN